MGPRDSALIPAPLHGAFGRDYSRDVQMQDLQHVRGGARGHYNDRGGKCGEDEERGRERDRYNERDRNRGWQCDAYRGSDSRDRNDRNNERDRVAETGPEIVTGTVAATETGSTR